MQETLPIFLPPIKGVLPARQTEIRMGMLSVISVRMN